VNHLNNNVSQADLNEIRKQYQGEDLDIVLNKIASGYPVQYVLGNVNFCGNNIKVNENVLIPRFETEFLVDLIKRTIPNDASLKMIDLGTGSGCIAISLAKIFPNSKITGIDISNKAIDIAEHNKELNKVTNVTFNTSDMKLIENYNGFNIIISNPPYVSKEEETGPETKYEPQNAIFASNNGLYYYEDILKKESLSTNKPEHIFFEIGMNQKEEIENLCNIYLKDYNVSSYKDLAGKNRYIHIILNK
jgi:release factor glutamine methyltransferase